jgi:FdhE protein
LELDWVAFSELYEKVCRVAAQHRPDLASDFGRLRTLLKDNPESLRAVLEGYLENGRLESREEEDETELLEFVLNHAMRPFLQAYADALGPLLKQELWQLGRCPICGGEPDLAFLDEESGARHLVCSRCDSQWVFPRVKCPFCNTSEPSDLSYFPSEDEKHRLYVCGNCKRYLKTIDLRKRRSHVLLLVERVTTVALDILARQEGYR